LEAVRKAVEGLAKRAADLRRATLMFDEASRFFVCPAEEFGRWNELPAGGDIRKLSDEIDRHVFDALGVEEGERHLYEKATSPSPESFDPSSRDSLSYCVGCQERVHTETILCGVFSAC
jgi:hypothetical protein